MAYYRQYNPWTSYAIRVWNNAVYIKKEDEEVPLSVTPLFDILI